MMSEAFVEREIGVARVTGASEGYVERALEWLPAIILDGEKTGEDIRHDLVVALGNPHHHNVFGAVILSAIRKGLIAKTGETRPMRDRQSHARNTPVYRIGP